ncbi:MAG TPA: hypothetical protein VGR14_15905 [Verrucomicrobiae bacterium]|jgi:hypothetical protein|nr:hypothetical protein [Verrucomicrobiae bacterium]
MNALKHQLINTLCLFSGMALLGLVGCGKDPGPPPPLAVEQIPAEMQKAFNNAVPEAKETVGRLISTLQSKDYPAAFQEVQALCNLPGETKEQRALAARALLSITGLLQTAQDQGDEKAAAALRMRQISR